MRRQTLLGKTRGFRSSTIDSDLFAMMSLLRTHQNPLGVPARGSNADICMHAAGPVRRSQTCGSMITLLEKNHGRPSMHRALHFFTGTSAPCLSVFKPAAMTTGENAFHVLNPDGHTIEGSLWRRFEPVHRHALFSADLRNEVRRTAAEAEREMRAILDRMDQPGNPSDTDTLKAAEAPVRDWTEKWINHAAKRPFSYSLTPYAWYWKRQNRLDGMA